MATERTAQVDGYLTRYYDMGTGPPIVLIHGGEPGGSAAADIWVPINVEQLASQFRILAPDRLGQGYTDNPQTPGDYRIGTICSHLATLIRSSGITDATLVGQSRGAYIAVHLAREHPDLARQLVLVNSLSIAPGRAARSKVFEDLVKGDPTTVRSDAEAMSVTKDHITDAWIEKVRAIRAQPKMLKAREVFSSVAPDYYADFDKQKGQTLEWVRGGGLTQPTLVCWGQGDPLTTLEDGFDLYRLFESSGVPTELHVFSGCGHYPFRERPRAFNLLVTEFATGHD